MWLRGQTIQSSISILLYICFFCNLFITALCIIKFHFSFSNGRASIIHSSTMAPRILFQMQNTLTDHRQKPILQTFQLQSSFRSIQGWQHVLLSCTHSRGHHNPGRIRIHVIVHSFNVSWNTESERERAAHISWSSFRASSIDIKT